jgi:hypothetical protein
MFRSNTPSSFGRPGKLSDGLGHLHQRLLQSGRLLGRPWVRAFRPPLPGLGRRRR